MGSRSYHETATREVRKQARLQADYSIRGTTVLAIKNNATQRLKTKNCKDLSSVAVIFHPQFKYIFHIVIIIYFCKNVGRSLGSQMFGSLQQILGKLPLIHN